jgi:hypothetical protein
MRPALAGTNTLRAGRAAAPALVTLARRETLPDSAAGYSFTGVWTLLLAIAMLQSSTFDDWLACRASPSVSRWCWARSSSSAASRSRAVAATIVPIAYVAWSLWLLAAGVLLLT